MSHAVADSHIHFGDPGHLPAGLRRAAAGVGLQGIVLVECGLHPDDRHKLFVENTCRVYSLP